MKLAIERIDSGKVVCQNLETEEFLTFDAANMPKNIKESDILMYTDGGKFRVDFEETEKRKKYMENLFKDLF